MDRLVIIARDAQIAKAFANINSLREREYIYASDAKRLDGVSDTVAIFLAPGFIYHKSIGEIINAISLAHIAGVECVQLAENDSIVEKLDYQFIRDHEIAFVTDPRWKLMMFMQRKIANMSVIKLDKSPENDMYHKRDEIEKLKAGVLIDAAIQVEIFETDQFIHSLYSSTNDGADKVIEQMKILMPRYGSRFLMGYDSRFGSIDVSFGDIQATADTYPLAVCRAALLYKLSKTPQLLE